MPAHPTQRGLRAFVMLLSLVLLLAFTTAPGLARPVYEIHDGGEGDPGDGVLRPSKPMSERAFSTGMTTTYTDGETVFSLPVVVLIDARGLPQLVIFAPTANWARSLGTWFSGDPSPISGRSRHAR